MTTGLKHKPSYKKINKNKNKTTQPGLSQVTKWAGSGLTSFTACVELRSDMGLACVSLVKLGLDLHQLSLTWPTYTLGSSWSPVESIISPSTSWPWPWRLICPLWILWWKAYKMFSGGHLWIHIGFSSIISGQICLHQAHWQFCHGPLSDHSFVKTQDWFRAVCLLEFHGLRFKEFLNSQI